MNSFVQRHAYTVFGMLSGWDRILFRGMLQMLWAVCGLMRYLMSYLRPMSRSSRSRRRIFSMML